MKAKLKLLGRCTNLSDSTTFVRIYRDTENQEYVLKLTIKGEYQEDCDYFTTDIDDADATAERMAYGN